MLCKLRSIVTKCKFLRTMRSEIMTFDDYQDRKNYI